MPAHLLAFALYGSGEKRALVTKLIVDRDLGDPGIGGNLLDRSSCITNVKKCI